MKVNILDVSIRDSYYYSNLRKSYSHISFMIHQLINLEIDAIEVGYFASDPYHKDHSNFLLGGNEAYFRFLQDLYQKFPHLQFYLMIHPEQCEKIGDLNLLDEDFIYCVRFIYKARYRNMLDKQIKQIKRLNKRVCLNITRVSEKSRDEVMSIARYASDMGVDVLYIADSNSNLNPLTTQEFIFDLKENISGHTALGFHPHDGMKLAFPNALAAIQSGGTFIDGSMLPFGKYDKQNLDLFILLFFLIKNYAFKINNETLYDTIQQVYTEFELGSYQHYISFIEGLLDRNIDELKEYYDNKNKEKKIILRELIHQI
jgi:Isopropylmalate/homocitrate/citramalate synthases